MSMIVDFGGESRDAVFQAFRHVVLRFPVKVLVLSRENEDSLEYRPFNGTVDEALATLMDGSNCSIQVECTDGSMSAGIYRPSFSGGLLQDWSGSVEGLGDGAASVFDGLREIDGLGYVALSKDESPDFETEHVTTETFPWEDWRLAAGAARSADGTWTLRQKEGS